MCILIRSFSSLSLLPACVSVGVIARLGALLRAAAGSMGFSCTQAEPPSLLGGDWPERNTHTHSLDDQVLKKVSLSLLIILTRAS